MNSQQRAVAQRRAQYTQAPPPISDTASIAMKKRAQQDQQASLLDTVSISMMTIERRAVDKPTPSFVTNLLLKTSPTILNPGRLRLFVSFYTDTADKYHTSEIRDCFTRNTTASYFDEVNVLCEDDESEAFCRGNYPEAVKIHRIPGRPTYKMIMEIANIDAREGDVKVLSHSDIIFTPSILALRYIALTNTAVCLHRWNYENGKITAQFETGSHDVWCWKTPIEDTDAFDFPVGTQNSHTRIAYELKSIGYNIINPCIDIITIHNHKNCRSQSSAPIPSLSYEYPARCVLNFDKFHKRNVATSIPWNNVLHIGHTTPELTSHIERACSSYRYLPANSTTDASLHDLILTFAPSLVFLNFDEPRILSTLSILRLRCMRAYIVLWSNRKLPFVDLHLTPDVFYSSFSDDIFNPVGPFLLDHPDITVIHPPNTTSTILADIRDTYGSKVVIYDKSAISTARQAEIYRSAKIAIVLNDGTENIVSDQRKEVAGCAALCLSQTTCPGDIGDIQWSTIEDLKERIAYYLSNEAERIRIAKTTCLRVHRFHTWSNRLYELQTMANASQNTDLDLV